MNQVKEFLLPNKLRINDLIKSLISEFDFFIDKNKNVTRAYLDSFDSRLYKNNLQLISERDVEEWKLILRSNKNPQSQRSVQIKKLPKFAWDIDSVIYRQKISEILGVRALIAQCTIYSLIHRLRYEDQEKKTCLHVFIENPQIQLLNNKIHRLGKRVILFPVTGYPEQLEKVSRYLVKHYQLNLASEDQFITGMNALNIKPGTYSSKLDIKLSPKQSAGHALNIAFRALLNTMLLNEEGVIQDIDSEFLHDFRVAVRRTRSVLGQLKHELPRNDVEYFRKEFGWLGAVTGPTRDWDVYLLNYSDYIKKFPDSVQKHLESLHKYIRKKRTKSFITLVRNLGSKRYKELVRNWQNFLNSTIHVNNSMNDRPKSVKKVADSRIWKIYRRVITEGRDIKKSSPYVELHELRISCKKLRYLIEIFSSLYPKKKMNKLIGELKQLQDTLGEFCDYNVQIQSFRDLERELVAEKELSPETKKAMDMLIVELQNYQLEKRAEIISKFIHFSNKNNTLLFKSLFNIQGKLEKTH